MPCPARKHRVRSVCTGQNDKLPQAERDLSIEQDRRYAAEDGEDDTGNGQTSETK